MKNPEEAALKAANRISELDAAIILLQKLVKESQAIYDRAIAEVDAKHNAKLIR